MQCLGIQLTPKSETSAHSLTFAVALLALYPNIQDRIYKETLEIWPDGCPSSASPSVDSPPTESSFPDFFCQSYKEYMPKLVRICTLDLCINMTNQNDFFFQKYTLATFQETIRLFTPVARLCKIVHADTTLTAHRFTSNSTGEINDIEPFSVPVEQGSMVVIDVLALHMNRASSSFHSVDRFK